MREVKKLTPWEAGQELIKAYDALGAAAEETAADFPELTLMLKTQMAIIARAFNIMKTHKFELPETAGQ